MSEPAVAAAPEKDAVPKEREVSGVVTPGVVARVADFPELQPKAATGAGSSLNHLLDVSVSVTAEVGRVTLSIADILKLGHGSVVGLDRAVSEPIDLLVQGVPFARGEVVVIDDRFAIRIREIVDSKYSGKK
jgi:flagellar motor switch protein FliN/FliY